jgi:hypothetical protein
LEQEKFLDLLYEIIKLPWLGAKVIVKAIAFSSVLLPAETYFNPPTVTVQQNQVYLQASIKNACTPKIKNLLLSATPVVVEFSVASERINKVVLKEYSYDPISNTGRIACSEAGASETFADSSKLDSLFGSVRMVLCGVGELANCRGMRVTVRAAASIKNEMVDFKTGNLWPVQPQATFLLDVK